MHSCEKLVILLLLAVYSTTEATSFDDGQYRSSLLSLIETSTKTEYWKSLTSSLKFPRMFRAGNDRRDAVDELVCEVCQATADVVILARQNGVDKSLIQAAVSTVCIDFGIENEEVCNGIIGINVDIFMYIIDNKPDILGSRVCSIFFQSFGCAPDMSQGWTIDIPDGHSPERDYGSGDELLSIIQISDFHYDPLYLVGGNAKCTEPICCQSDHPGPSSEEDACGYWGDYRDSDAPFHGVTTCFEQVLYNHPEIDIIYYTGDTVNHRVWSTSVESNAQNLITIGGVMSSMFENKTVFSVLGNHEPHPLNVWSPEEVGDRNVTTRWVYELSAAYWGQWLPEGSNETILTGGFYTALVRPGLRVIGLNTNVCYIYNWWLFYEDEDPYGQLKWLVEVLSEAEKNNESVHILAHIEPKNSYCLNRWSEQYRRITERFANTIKGQFNGHTHADTFSVLYNSTNPRQPINVAYNGGSVTSNTKKNPNYKVYHVNGTTYEVVDMDVWIFNLTEANKSPGTPPVWFKEYSFSQAYGVKPMGPEQLDGLVHAFTRNATLIETYFKYFKTLGEPTLAAGCNDNCYKDLLCNIVGSESGDPTQCDYITGLYENNVNVRKK